MNNEIKISVIVPIFNSEEYLKKCLDSIVGQKYSNLEIILINDGSTDSSKELIEEFAQNDSRIKYVHKSNGGIGSAYKVALEMITGDFISFVDSDDYIDLNMYQDLLQYVKLEDADIVQFGFNDVDENDRVFNTAIEKAKIIEGNRNIVLDHFEMYKSPSLACRIFRKKLFKSLILYDQSFGIDETTIVQLLIKAEKVVVVDKAYYYRFYRNNSISRSIINRKKLQDSMNVHDFLFEYIKKNRSKYLNQIRLKYLKYLLSAFVLSSGNEELESSLEMTKAKEKFKDLYRNIRNSKLLKNQNIKLKTSLMVCNFNRIIYVAFYKLFR